tara:strand:+ start:1057 stop:2250 length:1194 start_codon:yes stop_codon:yes gene_type:complete
MLFQALDNKKDCYGVYCDGEIHLEEAFQSDQLTKTWSYSPFLADLDKVEYAQLYCLGQSLTQVCPPELAEHWASVSSKLKAFLKSFSQAKISLDEHCFFDLVPERFLVEFCEVKNEITEHVIKTHKKPENYEFMKEVVRLTSDISSQSVNLDKKPLKSCLGSTKGRSLWKNFDGLSRRVVYNPYGTKTGRLTTVKASFPILTLAKEHRAILTPRNDWFVELDFNAAELRTLLSLAGEDQPMDDVHIWNVENVYNGKYDRDKAKQKIFAWLYNPKSKDKLASKAYKRDEVLEKYWDGTSVKTPFGRTIEADQKHALNYIIQSTTSDVFLDRAIALHKLLSSKKSTIAMLIHDSVIVDLANEDLGMVKEMVNLFSDTKLGSYRVGVKAGKNFGDLRKLL